MKFKPTKENLEWVAKSITVSDAEEILLSVLKEKAHDAATSYKLVINCDGVDSSMTTTGAGYLKANGISMKNIRGEWIK